MNGLEVTKEALRISIEKNCELAQQLRDTETEMWKAREGLLRVHALLEPSRSGDSISAKDLRTALEGTWPMNTNRHYGHGDNAGSWVHDDGTSCPSHWASEPTASEGRPWWCTEHQQHLHLGEAADA